MQRPSNFDEVVSIIKAGGSVPLVALACAADEAALEAVARAEREKIAGYLLFGDKGEILEAAGRAGVKLQEDAVVDVPEGEKDACARAVQAVSSGEAHILMKGKAHTSTLLRQVLNKEYGLRGGGVMSHVFIWEAVHMGRFIFVSDAALNIAPDLPTKVEIVKNAVRFAHSFGVEEPKVALMAAVETVNPKMPATLDAAAIAQMARRGQLGVRAVVDGPFALDNAISEEAARAKGIESPVAGKADILIAPDIEAGNVLGKAYSFLVPGGRTVGLIVGGAAPIIITSRADSAASKFCSIVAAVFSLLPNRG